RPAVLPPRRRAESAGERLQVDPGREDAGAEGVLEVAAPVQAGDLPRHLLGIERVDPGRPAELGGEHRRAGLERAGRARAGVEQLLPPAAVVVAAGRGVLAGVDGALE